MIQSRIASLVASLSVFVPNSTGADLGAEQVHPLDVRCLPAHVLGAHVDDAVEPEARADSGGRDAVLAGAGLCDDPPLAEPLCEHRLAERVVQLVGARVEEVFALQVDAAVRVEAGDAGERRRAAAVVRAELVELAPEGIVGAGDDPAGRELVECRDQRLRDIAAAVDAERSVRRSSRCSTHARTAS